MSKIPYDPEVHKGYTPLYKNGQLTYAHPSQVKGLRAVGYKTYKEYIRHGTKRAKKSGAKEIIVETFSQPG